jgi:hypothetical protein
LGDQFLYLKRFTLGRFAPQGEGFLWAMRNAHPTAHAGGGVDACESIVDGNRRELAVVNTRSAGSTQLGLHLGDVPRRGQHRRAVLVGMHRPTTARAAVADGVESTQHGIFEESMADMAPLLLGVQELHCLFLAEPARASRVMFGNKAGKRLADDKADVEG